MALAFPTMMCFLHFCFFITLIAKSNLSSRCEMLWCGCKCAIMMACFSMSCVKKLTSQLSFSVSMCITPVFFFLIPKLPDGPLVRISSHPAGGCNFSELFRRPSPNQASSVLLEVIISFVVSHLPFVLCLPCSVPFLLRVFW